MNLHHDQKLFALATETATENLVIITTDINMIVKAKCNNVVSK